MFHIRIKIKRTLCAINKTVLRFYRTKKKVTDELPATYETNKVESGWYEWWEQEGFFKPNAKATKSRFSMIIPPPNVTGSLHLGHALTNSIQDAIIRWKRMNGYQTVWYPGCDHAGIATQVVVEKLLWRDKKKTRHEIGREEFLKYVWKWKEEKENTINQQLRRLGSSLDWSRSSFTMDEKFEEAVTEAFIKLHDAGEIYRMDQVINWCCYLQSTISDIEIEHIQIPGRTKIKIPGYKAPVEFGVLYYVKYQLEPNPQSYDYLTVATTRPETIFGDVAIAIHPKSKALTRNEESVTCGELDGFMAINPLNGNRIKLIKDVSVDPEFGTGAVKVTPAHDANDFWRAYNYKINKFIEVIDDKGLMNENCGEFKGLPRFEARKAIVEKLIAKGSLLREDEHSMSLPLCSRSGDVIEPRKKWQWFLDTEKMANKAIDVLSAGVQFVPHKYDSLCYTWLSSLHDWCLSRQLSWGHRIPAYRLVSDKVETSSALWVSARNIEEATAKAAKQLKVDAKSIKLEQDQDVLDTWFSSALFPFACMGWPKETLDLKQFYPLDLMETGHDILNFWVSRMLMLGIRLTNTVPFQEVLLHGIVCDIHGRKMSKSLGNVIDPLDIINGISLEELHQKSRNLHNSGILSKEELKKCIAGQKKDYPNGIPPSSADALRFALCSYDIKAQNINLDVRKTHRYRLFCNKIWQASRFVFGALEKVDIPQSLNIQRVEDKLTLLDKWILSCLATMVCKCNDSFMSYDLHIATLNLNKFIYTNFCDVYLEAVKPIIRDGSNEDREVVATVLLTCLHTSLLAISPFMPFLSEELYQRLPITEKSTSISVATYPQNHDWLKWKNETLENNMTVINEIVQTVRSICLEFSFKQKPAVVINSAGDMFQPVYELKSVLNYLLKVPSLRIDTTHTPDETEVARSVRPNVIVHVSSNENKLDQEKVLSELTKRATNIQRKLEKLIAKMILTSGYKDPDALDDLLAKKEALENKLNEINNNINVLQKIVKS